jgi:hypothetical protein
MSDRSKTSVWPRITAIAAASFLFARAMRRGRANWLLLTIAGELFRFGLTGRSLFHTSPHESAQQEDIVDLASELSFPASDPPAY